MKISVYEPAQDKHGKPVPGWHPIPVEISWAGLGKLLGTFTETPCHPCPGGQLCVHKIGRSWSPVEMDGTRRSVNARTITAAVFDLDHISPAAFAAMCERLEGYAAIVHSTHSHRPHDWCLRLVMPLSCPVLASDWETIWHAIVNAFALPKDDHCKDTSRVYYLPSYPAGQTPIYLQADGQALHVESLLAYGRQIASAPSYPEPAPVDELSRDEVRDLPELVSIDLASLTDRLKELKYRKSRSIDPVDMGRYQILSRILKGTPIAMPGFTPSGESARQGLPSGRGSEINKAASLLAFAFPSGTPTAAAIEVMRPCLSATDIRGDEHGRGLYEFKGKWGIDGLIATFADSYDRSMARRQKRDAHAEALDQALRERLGGMLPLPPPLPSAIPQPIEYSALPPGPPPPAGPVSLRDMPAPTSAPMPPPTYAAPPSAPQAPPEPDPYAGWQEYILKKKDGSRACVGENAFTILAFSEATRRTLRWNMVEKTIEVSGGPFAKTPSAVLDIVVTDWLTRFWDVALSVNEVGQRLLRVAHANQYDPLAEYLYGLQWDGYSRVDDFLVRYCDARLCNLGGQNIELHINDIGRKWLIAHVARALNPGAKVDTVLILEGDQGDYKSQMLEVLGGRWYCGDILDIGSNESKMLATKNWVIEIAELDAFMKVDNSGRKKFFSMREDQFREPYAKTTSKHQRRAVFTGTYNPKGNETYFSDESGNRRYWPARCGHIRIRDIIKDRDQIWAQAVHYYLQYQELARSGVDSDQNPYRWWYNKAEQATVDQHTEERMTPSVAVVKIAEWWATMHPARRPVEVTTIYVAEHALGYSVDKLVEKRPIETLVGTALKTLGFEKHRPTRNGIPQYTYFPSDALKNLPMAQGRGHLQLMTDEIAKRVTNG